MKHLALAVTDQERSRRFYESYFGFDARPSRWYDDGVLMLYNAEGFSLALGPTDEPIRLPAFLHFGIDLPSRDAVLAFRDRLAADGVVLPAHTRLDLVVGMRDASGVCHCSNPRRAARFRNEP